MPHRRRPVLSSKHPVLVTWRMLPHVWNLRSQRCFSRLRECFERGRDRFGLRLVHFSVQGNHLHLVVEALDERSLARGMQGLGVRIAKALNHARQLTSPTQVANAVTYVLLNYAHHFPEEARRAADVRDRFSSAWRDRGRDPPVVAPRTWLLRLGWRLRADERVVMLVDAAAPPAEVTAVPRAA